jgi:hypothetical protein
MAPTLGPNNGLDNFDDIVTIKENWQMQTLNNPVTPSFMYIADYGNNRIRKVSASIAGIITTVAGNGTFGYNGDGGAATNAGLPAPQGVAVDGSGNLYISSAANVIRKVVASTGIITTIVGNGNNGSTGDGGLAINAQIYGPQTIAFDSSGNFYIADTSNSCIRKVTISTGIITTVAGHTTAGACDATSGLSGDGGAATSAKLHTPYGVALDGSGNIYVADTGNSAIRKVVAATGIITTVTGLGVNFYWGDGGAATSAAINDPGGVAVDGFEISISPTWATTAFARYWQPQVLSAQL